MDEDLIDEPRRDVLLTDGRAAHDAHVLLASDRACSFESRDNPVGKRVDAAFGDGGGVWLAVRHDDKRHAYGAARAVRAPPANGAVVGAPSADHRPGGFALTLEERTTLLVDTALSLYANTTWSEAI